MSRVRFDAKRIDYDNGVQLNVRIYRTHNNEEKPTFNELLDVIKEMVDTQIRQGHLHGELLGKQLETWVE